MFCLSNTINSTKMKIKLLITTLLAIICMHTNAQTGTPYGSIGPYFIGGLSPVNNTITIDAADAPTGTYYVYFFATDNTYNLSYDSLLTSGNGPWSWTVDMGTFPLGTLFWAYYYDNAATLLDYSNDYITAITPIPVWLQSPFYGTASVQNVNVSGNSIALDCSLPITELLLNQSVPSMVGIGGETFDMSAGNLGFSVNFDMATNTSSATPAQINFLMNTIGASNSYNNGTNNFNSAISLDANFNILFNGTATWTPNPITKSFELNNVPLLGFTAGNLFSGGGLCVSANLGFDLQPKIKSQIVLGYDASTLQWGFIQSGAAITKILGKVTATATAEGSLKTVCASLFGLNFGIGTIARGKIDAQLSVGGGISFTSLTSPSNYFGGSFSISAEGQIAGFDNRSGTYGPNTWGNLPNFRQVGNYTDPFLNFTANTAQINSSIIPPAWPKGIMSARDSLLSVVWIDDVNFTSGKNLLITDYNPFTNSFSSPQTIAYNDSAIETPSVALMPSHRSLVTWSQLNISTSQIDTINSTIDDLVKKQDVWFAIYDDATNSVIYKNKLSDNTGRRPDGTPKIHWGAGNKGMITWQVGDTVNFGSKIYYSEITENGNNYSFSAPTMLANLPGYNYDIHVSYYDATNAVAEWINDPDMNDATDNSQVYFSYWNGSNWSADSLRYNIQSGTRLKEITLDVNGNYGLDAVTYEYYNSDSTLMNGIYVSWWNSANPSAVQNTWLEDSSFVFQIPRAAVSQNGIASFILQSRNLTNSDNYGQLDLYMNDLSSAVGWQYVSNATDTNEFVWDMSSVFGFLQSANSHDIMYLFTQEMDSVGNTNPTHGAKFGHPDLNLVLRALNATSNGGNISLSYVTPPSDSALISYYQEIKPFNYDFELKQNYPNPFSQQTTIPFHISKTAKIKIDLTDLMGRTVATILDKELSVGDYQTQFNSGNLESGIYYYTITANNKRVTKKMVVAK